MTKPHRRAKNLKQSLRNQYWKLNFYMGIKEETKNLRQKVDVIAKVLTRIEATNKVYFDTILETTKKHSEET